MTSFTYFPAISDMNVILSEGLFSQVAAHVDGREEGDYFAKNIFRAKANTQSWIL